MNSTRGSLSEIGLIEILKNSAASNLTGMIRLENGPVIKVIYFQNGTIAFASSNEKADRLTEVLKRAGKLTPEQVEDAQSRLKPNISLGKTLVELGYISARDLLWGARAQVEGILYQLLFWTEGIYQVMEGSLPKEIIVLNLSVPGVIFEGVCKTSDRDWVLQQIGTPESIYRLVSDFHEKYIPHKLRMLRADDIVSRMDGKRSIEQIAHLAGIDTFEACKVTAALQLLSLAEKVPELIQSEEDEPFAVEEVPEQESVEIQEEESPAPALAVVGKAEQLFLEPAPVSLGQMMQIPSVEELHDTQEGESERSETANTTNIVEAAVEPPEGQLALDESGLEPVSLAEPEPPSESVFVVAAREEAAKTSRSSWMIAVLLFAALIVSAYYYYTTQAGVSVAQLHLQKQIAQPPAKRVQSAKPAPSTPPVATQTPTSTKQPSTAAPQTAPSAAVNTPPPQAPAPKAPAPKPPQPAAVQPETPQATIPLPTPQVSSPPSASLSSDRLALIQAGKLKEAAAEWQRSLTTQKAKFAVQLAIACQPDTVTDAVARFGDKSKFYILPLQFKGQPCYRVMVGNFDDEAAAETARQGLPAEFLQLPSPPQIVPVTRLLK